MPLYRLDPGQLKQRGLILHAQQPEARDYEAYLNGERLECCVCADEEEGWAVVSDDPRAFPFNSSLRLVTGKIELRRKDEA